MFVEPKQSAASAGIVSKPPLNATIAIDVTAVTLGRNQKCREDGQTLPSARPRQRWISCQR
jgi:hypothetical protein